MSIDQASLGSFGDLGVALGLLTPDGQPNASWFSDPVTGGTGVTPHGLKHVLEDNDQRAALTRFVDQILGPPEARTRSGATWVPLFQNADPTVTVYAVLAAADNEIRLGFGVEHTTKGAAPTVSTRVHVPLFRFPERDHTLVPDGIDPIWLAFGRPGGEIELAVDATLSDTAPAAGASALGGVALAVEIPTYDGDVGFEITLRDLQLPGATAPQTFTLDVAHPHDIGPKILDLASGLIRAQADALGAQLNQPALRPFAGLAGLLGLRTVSGLTALHLAELPTRGMSVFVEWVETVMRTDAARRAWLGQLALLIGGELNSTGDRVVVPITDAAGVGRVEAGIGVRVENGTGGHPILVPWADVSLTSRAGVKARAAVDLLRADTATGACLAVPDVRVEGVFGAHAGGSALVSNLPQLGLGSLHVGVGLDARHQPTFVLTAHNVVLDGASRDLVDLSTPDAALAAGADLVTGALTSALAALHDAGDLVSRLLGITATGAVPAISVPDLVADPIATVRGHWQAVLADSAAMQDLLGRLSALVRGAPAALAPGAGDRAHPWQVELADLVRLEAWRQGGVLHVDAVASVDRTIWSDLTLTTKLGFGLARLDFATPGVSFATGATLSARIARADAQPLTLAAGPFSMVGDDLEIEARWQPGAGLGLQLSSDQLALHVDSTIVALPLPSISPDGRLTFSAPDWDGIEVALATLVSHLGVPEIDAAFKLLGWTGSGPHLSLAALLDGTPVDAIEAWLADLVLDCDRVRAVLGPVAQLLSGFSISAPLGSGNARDPFRCPIAGEPRAPGLRVWVDPGCAVKPGGALVATGAVLGSTPPDPETIAVVLRAAGQRLPDVADLMVGRDSLGQGLQLLVDRWRGTDGVVGKPATLPPEVNALELVGLSEAEIAALGWSGSLVPRVLASAAPVVHVSAEPEVLADRPAGSTYDLSGSGPPPAPPTGSGPWFVRVPTPSAAALARPDRGGVGEQAARLVALLEGHAGDLVLVGYADAGAAAVRAAASLDHVTDVITVGTPWADTSVMAYTSGLGADALQLLGRLQRPEVPVWPDPLLGGQCTPLQRTRLLVRRCLAALRADAQPPRADSETRRASLTVHAVFGSLDNDSLLRGLGAFVADALEARAEPLTSADPGAVTAVHVALEVPVLDLDLGGLLVGVGASFETCRLSRGAGPGLDASLARGLVVEVHLGVHDGWLVGGPGSTGTSGDLRWMAARVEVPFDGSPGNSELILHEARALGADRETWVVRAGADGVSATVAVPEVCVLLGDLVTRLRTSSPQLATLLTHLGLLAPTGGLDTGALDRLLHDPGPTVRAAFAAAPAELAAALRELVPGATGSGAAISWVLGPATVGLDLATGGLTGSLSTDVEGLLPIGVEVTAGPTSHATLSLGSIDEHLGGVRVRATAGPSVDVAVEWSAAGGTVRTAGLWPTFEPAPLTDLVAITVPALAVQGVVSALLERSTGAGLVALEAGLSACGLIRQYAEGGSAVVLPLAFVQDPAAYVMGVARSGSADLAAAGHDVLEALAHLVTPTPPADGTWPITNGVELRYAVDGDALTCALHVTLDETLDGVQIESTLAAGAVLRPGVAPAPTVDVAVRVDGIGLEVTLDPGLRVSMLRPVPLAPLPLYPDGPGLGQAFATAATTLLPELLNRIADLSGGSTGVARDIGTLVGELGDALALREAGDFTSARIALFAADPSAALLGHLPALIGEAATALAAALNGSSNRVAVRRQPGSTTFGFGTSPGPTLSVTLDTTGSVPAVDLSAQWQIPDVGTVRLDALRISSAGVDIGARIGPIPVHAGPVALRPMLSVRAGTAASTDRLLGVGLALDDAASQSVELRWGLDASPPVLAAVDRDSQGVVTRVSEPDAPVRLLSVGVSLAGGVMAAALPTTLLNARVVRMLRGVVFTEAATTPDLDPSIGADLLLPERLLLRLERLLWNVATDSDPLKLTIDDKVTIALASTPGSGDDRSLGVSLSLKTPATRFTLADGDVKVELEVDATWLDPQVTPGIAVYVVHAVRSGTDYTFDLRPGFSVAGLGVRFTKTSGPLLSVGPIALEGVAVRVYAEANAIGVGGGAQVELVGLAVAPAGAGGSNTVANGIMNDAGQASPSQRPVFSPALAVQRHPGDTGFAFSIRAGRPPGPWWIVVQRQLGPLYIERLGFDSAETAGRVSRIALLFDGRVEIFGLTAAVDQLTITWHPGGDLFDIHQWEVDLMGLAISADLSGIVLAGGLLKTIDGTGDDQVISYVGMLLGRFGIYGLTVFGGYANIHGDPSFFVFGAVNGPIGGPPAFFITGLGGGLGINRRLVIPEDPREFPAYPFIMALDPYASVPDPMTELRRLNDFFGPERGSFWFAAGISFTCFSLVDGIAVVAVAFGNGLEINLLGLARMALPNPAAPLVSIELGLLARFSEREGVFLIRAALTDNSWLLYRDVRLTGGFAFATWWKGPLSGQFVLTIGGYHPDFHVEGYPDVPRVGLVWQVTDDIVIKGGSYFALTSEALMAGVGVEAVADFGWAWARVRFGADGLIYFDPFWYDVSVYAQISAGVTIDTWLFGTISISITTGAAVHVWGPDFSGEASVQVGPCSVSVPFGANARREGQVLPWPDFVAKYLEDAGSGTARALSGITGRGSLPAATGGNRSAPPPDGSWEHPFEVFAEFEITFVSTVPTTAYDLGLDDDVNVQVVRSDGSGAALGLNPMKSSGLSSVQEIRLEQWHTSTSSWVDDSADLRQLQHTVGTGSFPIGVWGPPDLVPPDQAPTRLPAGDVLFAGNQVTLVAAASGMATGPQIDYYKVEAGRRELPLQAQNSQRVALTGVAAGVALPSPGTPAAALDVAATLLFDTVRTRTVKGLQPSGARSQTARASYRGGVAAPPLFGALTDGLAVDNGDPVASAPVDAPPPARAPAMQDPRVLGYFAAGSAVALRSDGTTVADGGTKRRPAPTLDSVHTRLGRLPIALDVAGSPGARTGRTVTPPALPFTAVSGASYATGSSIAGSRVAGITGFGGLAPKGARSIRSSGLVAKAADAAPPTLASGDVVVLHAPDHATDVSEARPVLDLGGTARLTILRGDGAILLDGVRTGAVEVPAGAALLSVQADGTVDAVDGCAGWHSRSRVAALSGLAATGAGCTIVVDAGLGVTAAGWTTAGDLVRDAARVLTRFATSVQTVAVVVESDTPERVGDMGLELIGATRAVGADGKPIEARLVMNGAQVVAVYDVVPDPAHEAVAVSVASGGGWRLTGVLGSTLSSGALSKVLVGNGLLRATARLGAVAGRGCSPAWSAAQPKRPTPKRRTPKRRTPREEGRRGR